MSLITKNFFLDDFFDDFFPSPRFGSMRCDIYEKDGDYHIEVDIPGFNKDDISVELNDGYLTITADKKEEVKDEGKNYIRRERRSGRYTRSFYVGDVDTDDVDAEFKDGLLKIVIPKKAEVVNKKRIEIK